MNMYIIHMNPFKYFHKIHCDITKSVQGNKTTFSNDIVFLCSFLCANISLYKKGY
jgi:hypothetical protein